MKPRSSSHRSIVAQARQPAFYTALGVPDTLDGRFELIALHGFLVMHRLKADAGRDRAGARPGRDDLR